MIPRPLLWTVAAAAVVLASSGCGRVEQAETAAAPAAPATPGGAAVRFVDVAAAVGLDRFQQVNGTVEKRHITDTTGAGAALFDYDGDGDLDVFLVNGTRQGFPAGQEPSNALFRNEGKGATFRDVTAEAGLLSRGAWGQGCAVADVDGDGDLDLYVTNYGPNVLYLNQGNGTFADVTARAGVGDPSWSTGATFFDYDGDGDLDLYVANYVAWNDYLKQYPEGMVANWQDQKVFGGPRSLPAAPDLLYRNQGDGTFADVSRESGVAAAPPGYGFQPVPLDYDDDGRLDLFVANDTSGNYLWHNQGNGTFREVSTLAGLKFDEHGKAQTSMGVAIDDYDQDGRQDIYITVFSEDLNPLYRAAAAGQWDVVTGTSGLTGEDAWKALGWGAHFFDADNDGRLDLFAVNGHTYPQADKVEGFSYAQRNLFYLQRAGGRFEDVSLRSGPGMEPKRVGRGLAVGDIDDDGDLDLLINNLDGTPTLLRNESTGLGNWLLLRLVGRAPNTSAIGARVTVTSSAAKQMRMMRSSESFLSVNDPRLHYGIGAARQADRIEVRWPDGSSESIGPVPANVLATIVQGSGRAETRPLP